MINKKKAMKDFEKAIDVINLNPEYDMEIVIADFTSKTLKLIWC